MFECVGALHIHSTYSDGAKSVPAVTRHAGQAGLDFIVFHDHDTMTDALHLEEEGIHGGVLVLMGLEIGEQNHHYLAFDLKKMIRGRGLSPQEVIDRVRAQDGFGFLAHPFEKGMPFMEGSVTYRWNDLSVSGYTGICIWNFSSRWKERVKSIIHALFFLTFKSKMLKGPSVETMKFWDEVCRRRKVAAVGGSDAHGSAFVWGGLAVTPLTYEFVLGAVTTHIFLWEPLSAEFEQAKRQVYEALREGRGFVAHDALTPARGFRCTYTSEAGETILPGQEAPFRPGAIRVIAPRDGRIRILRNGSQVERQRGTRAFYRVGEPGVYRVEVYRRVGLFGWRPWIFSNPVYLR
jgi:hypothetical protein